MMAFQRLTLNLSLSAVIPPGVSAVLSANRLGNHTRSGTTRYRLNLTAVHRQGLRHRLRI